LTNAVETCLRPARVLRDVATPLVALVSRRLGEVLAVLDLSASSDRRSALEPVPRPLSRLGARPVHPVRSVLFGHAPTGRLASLEPCQPPLITLVPSAGTLSPSRSSCLMSWSP
jgi:hypothetical protein